MSELDTMDKPQEGAIEIDSRDYSVLPACPPYKKSVTEMANTPVSEWDSLPRYYASQLLHTTGDLIPPVTLLAKDPKLLNKDELQIFSKFVNAVSKLEDSNDVCDRVGIEFLAKAFKLLDGELNARIRIGLTGFVNSNQDVMRYAKALAESK